jgi:hypothetical protein
MKEGDRVLICLPNIPQAVIAIYALSRLGAIPAPIHPLSTTSEILAFARLVSASWAITLDGFFPRFAEIAEGTAGLRRGRFPRRLSRYERTIVCGIGRGGGLPDLLRLRARAGAKDRARPLWETVLSWSELETASPEAPELERSTP